MEHSIKHQGGWTTLLHSYIALELTHEGVTALNFVIACENRILRIILRQRNIYVTCYSALCDVRLCQHELETISFSDRLGGSSDYDLSQHGSHVMNNIC